MQNSTNLSIDCVDKLKVLADETRLAVLQLLIDSPKRVGEMNAILHLEQSLLSHHLQVLRRAKLVVRQRDGKAFIYRLAPQDAIIETSLQDVGLWDEVKDRLQSSALALSGGQQQRLCIARALALQPEVLLLDEPCSALDPISSNLVEDLILSLRQRYTLLIVTHNLAQAKRIADRVALFWVQDDIGQLIESGTVEQVFNHPQHPLTVAYITGARG